ncbi:hypothetical protein [Kitasatospora sp. NPDC097643]|uniref:hypothetical protein n=1 Tax=Kitasatospora sp. NPDC097643 TaxID=3157230 RepID=UPI00331B9CAA
MGWTGIKGRGRERPDTVVAWVCGVLAATIDGLLLSFDYHSAAQSHSGDHRPEVTAALALIGLVLFAALLGAAIAGQRSTVQRRWRCATVSALLSHLLLPMVLLIAVMIHPPTFVF